MRITRVELTNIKSYAYAAIDLRGGVTAIRGHNGAGKSTILEAIGWALFDHLPYKQKQFVREGETSGKVVVSFISPLDNRDYQVTRRCGARADWMIYDAETGMRIDSNVDVLDFLRRHMRLESRIALKDLFVSALGAPQGTLTADFLETPTLRKAKFDQLLQVEDYSAAAKKLLETANHLKDQMAQADVRIAGLERDAAQLDGWRAQREEQRAAQRTTAQRLTTLEADLEQAEAQRARLQAAQTELTRRAGAAGVAAANHEAARQQLALATQQAEESRLAAQTLAETRSDHEAHLRAERQRAQAQQRAQRRDALQQQRAQAAASHERAASDVAHAEARLAEVARAEQRIVALQPALERQAQFEQARDAARRDTQSLGEIRARLDDLRAKRARAEREVAARERETAEIETARPVAAALEQRRAQVEALQALAATREQHQRRQAAIERERAQLATRRAEADASHVKQSRNVRNIEEMRPLAERAGDIEHEGQAAEQAVREIETRLEQHRQARDLSGAGHCPFLREPCLNIQRRGENSLATYFDRLIAEDERALTPALAERERASEQAKAAQRAANFYAQLDAYREQQAQAARQVAECDEQERALTAEQGEIAQALAAANDVTALDDARRALRASEQADKRLATLGAAQRAVEQQRTLLRELSDEQAQLSAREATLAGAPDALRAAEAELARLGDPRTEAAGQRALAVARPQVERERAQAGERQRALAAELARLDEELAPYTTLAAELAALEDEIARARPGHTRYVQHERAAERLAEREQALRAAGEAEAQVAREQAAAEAALAEARVRFDEQALAEVTTRASELVAARGQLREAQRHLAETLDTLDGQIAHGEELLVELAGARGERTELSETLKTLEQFRETIKEAGPLVTQRLLSQISAQANSLFGEIIGDRSAELAWVRDYEITLTRDGRERTFALLSGGEQMAAALATRLALLRRLTGLDIAFFDEPTQNMDSERRSALAEQIRRVRGFDQLIVISHDDTFEQGLDSVIHLEKRGGATQVRSDDDAFADAPALGGELANLAGFAALEQRLDAGIDMSALVAE